MDIDTLVGAHGYWILVLGCLLEGETVVTLAGFAAHRGYLDFATVVVLAALTGFAGDQTLFWLGRRHGPAMLSRFPSIDRRAERVRRLIIRYPSLAIIGVRFAYGLRLAGPVLIGATSISALRFALLNVVGALLWSISFASAGWVFGGAVRALLGDIRQIEGWLLGAGVAVAGGIWLARRLR